ncbi:hypothetical protein [Pseudoalteromonas phenolica]|uniref:hypothetical protein n=1 Tax=Pseudoalteromonas phenolica TaxID=161398 RepID=UPI00384D08B3
MDVSQKICLLLNDFTPERLNHFITNIDPTLCEAELQDSINKPVSRMTYQRWINDGTEGKHSFFRLSRVQDYLSEDIQEKDKIVQSVHELLTDYFPYINSRYSRKTTTHLIATQYDRLIKSTMTSNENEYEAIENMGTEALPYYKERLLPEFLDLHIQSVKNFVGEAAYQTIKSKLLKVRNPDTGQEFFYPTIDLMANSQNISLSKNLVYIESQEPPESFLNAVKKNKPGIFNAATFALRSFSQESGELECSVSNYFKALYYCDKHFYSILGGYPGLESPKINDYINNPNLKLWAQQISKLVVDNDFTKGEYSLGSACLFIYNTQKGYQALLAKMAPKANSFNETHVIPASMFQPVLNNPFEYESELNFKDQVIREVAEEIFGYPELTGSHSKNYLTEIYAYPEVAHLERLFKSRMAEFHVTGLCLDLYRLRPEILSTIIVHDVDWANEQFPSFKKIGNWETIDNGIVPITLDEDTFYKVCSSTRLDPLCAPGIASFVHGYRKFKEVMATRANDGI